MATGANGEQSKEESQQSAYVPPHMRGKSAKPGAPQFSLGHSEDQGGRIKSGPMANDSGVPGGNKSITLVTLRRISENTWIVVHIHALSHHSVIHSLCSLKANCL